MWEESACVWIEIEKKIFRFMSDVMVVRDFFLIFLKGVK